VGRLLALGLTALVLVSSPAAAASPKGAPGSIDEMFERFGVAGIPADFVVVVDTSGSMSFGADPLYPRVQLAYRSLVAAIPAGDNLYVLTFDSDPATVFQGKIDAASRPKAQEALPSDANGASTDIGSALNAALRRLESANASGVQTVLFLTDGLHQPAAGSNYPGVQGPAWDELRGRAGTVDATRDLLVTGVGLGAQGAGGASLLRNVFGDPEIVSLPPEQLPDYFREAVRRSQLARLRLLVDKELKSGLTVTPEESATLENPTIVDVEVASNLERLPVEVTVNGVSVTDAAGRPVEASVKRRTFVLGPGERKTVPVRVEPDVKGSGFQFPAKVQEEAFAVRLDSTFQVQPADLLAGLTTAPSGGPVAGTTAVEASQTYGWTLRQVVTALVVLLFAALVLLWIYRTFIQLPPLVGVLELDDPPDPGDPFVRLSGTEQLLTGADVPFAGDARLRLYTRRRRRRRVFAQVLTPPFYELGSRGREDQVVDDTEIRLGRYRLGAGEFWYQAQRPAATGTTNAVAGAAGRSTP